MREPEDGEVIRKVRIDNAVLAVSVEEEPDDIHEAIADALPGAHVDDFDIVETFTVEEYGNEDAIGEDGVVLDPELVEMAFDLLEEAQSHGETSLGHDEVRPSTLMLANKTQGAYRALVKAHPDYELEEPDARDDV